LIKTFKSLAGEYQSCGWF